MSEPTNLDTPEKIKKTLENKPLFDSNEAKKPRWMNLVKIPRICDISNEFDKTISVIITNHRWTPFVKHAINNIVRQNFPHDMYEIIIVDDNSGETHLKTLKTMGDLFPNVDISLYETHKNITHNIALAFNIGLKRAKYNVVINNPTDCFQRGDYMRTVSSYHTHFANKGAKTAISGLILCRVKKQLKADFQIDARPYTDVGLAATRSDLCVIGGYCEQMRGWGSNEPNFTGRLGLSGVGGGFTSDLIIATSLGGELTKLVLGEEIGPIDRGHTKEWEPTNNNGVLSNMHMVEKIANPNGDQWGELDTLEKIL